MGIGAALIGSAVVGGVGSAIASGNQASAAKSAAATQAQAAEDALAQQKATTQQVLGIEKPFVDAGGSAIPGYESLLGINPQAPGGPAAGTGSNPLTGGAAINPTQMNAALAATPGYQFALKQGLMATQNGFAAQGLPISGAAIKGAGQYAEGLAGTQYQSILGNYRDAVAMGGNAAANFGSSALGGQTAANQLTVGVGQATASGIVGAANATAGGINALTGGIGNAATTLAFNNAGLFGNTGGAAASSIPMDSGFAAGGF